MSLYYNYRFKLLYLITKSKVYIYIIVIL